MAKKSKDAAAGDQPNPNSVKDKDLMQRLSFLYQTSVYLAQASGQQPPEPKASGISEQGLKENKKRRKGRGKDTLLDLSRQHTQTMKAIGRKAVLRMDPSVKRTICKGCQTVLIPGVSCNVRVKSSPTHSHVTRYICTHCKAAKSIPSPPTLDPTPNGEGSSSKPPDKRARKPPLFQQDASHVVFVGNDRTPGPNPTNIPP